MGLDEDNAASETKSTQRINSTGQEGGVRHNRKPSEASCYATEDEEERNEEEVEALLQLGPKCSIKEHLEKDKDYESLRRWKEQLLGSVNVNLVKGRNTNGALGKVRRSSVASPASCVSCVYAGLTMAVCKWWYLVVHWTPWSCSSDDGGAYQHFQLESANAAPNLPVHVPNNQASMTH